MEKLQLQLQTQGRDIVTITTGEIPLIHLVTRSLLAEILSWSVNFLRSGSPAVQISVTRDDATKKDLEDHLAAVRIGKERFKISASEPTRAGQTIFTMEREETRTS